MHVPAIVRQDPEDGGCTSGEGQAGEDSPKVPGARKKPAYASNKTTYIKNFMASVDAGQNVDSEFVHPCAACEYNRDMKGKNPTSEVNGTSPFNADHMHEANWGCKLNDLANFKMLNERVNNTVKFGKYKPGSTNKDQPIQADGTCQCPNGPPGHDPGTPSCSDVNVDGTSPMV